MKLMTVSMESILVQQGTETDATVGVVTADYAQERASGEYGVLLAMSTSCSKFPEKLFLFKKVANLHFHHSHIQ